MNGIAGFRNRHRGADIYVLAAGGSLNYLDQGFFEGKITVAVNEVARLWPITPTYQVRKEFEAVGRVIDAHPDVPLLVSRFDCGNYNGARADFEAPNVYVYDHNWNPGQAFDAAKHWPTDSDALVASWSTTTTAMHFAAYLGAATIIVVAHDCGQLGDDPYVRGYWTPEGLDTLSWLCAIEAQSLGVKEQLVARYGVRVYSLSPFLNYNLDGVAFIGRNRINVGAAA